jgi:protein-disulfide isomerase
MFLPTFTSREHIVAKKKKTSAPPNKPHLNQKPKKSKKPILGIFAMLAGGAILASSFVANPIPEAGKVTPVAEAVDFGHIDDMTVGAKDAPVTMVEYLSFTCSHCADFANEVYPDLKQDYIDTGKVQMVFREIYTHKAGLWASMVARCEGGRAFEPIAKDIFKEFGSWSKKQDFSDIRDSFKAIGQQNGLDRDEVESCLADEIEANALVARSHVLGSAQDIHGTPTFVIDGEVVRNQPYKDLKLILDDKIAETTGE